MSLSFCEDQYQTLTLDDPPIKWLNLGL